MKLELFAEIDRGSQWIDREMFGEIDIVCLFNEIYIELPVKKKEFLVGEINRES